ncbi:MAG: hypothetical protein Q8R69_19040 [Telluria sp.]|nr:hypothetical protein [Telluria sp.]
MSKFSDDILMAFADGELDEATRQAVQQAMRSDPAIAAAVARHQALRSDVFGAYAGTLDEALPQRLQLAASAPKVVQLDAVRAARQHKTEPRRWAWPEWGAIAATLVLGVAAGSIGVQGLQGDTELASVAAKDGALMARGKLAKALSAQLASAAPAQAQVRIGLSFVSKQGNYCRSFMLAGAAGLACRDGDEWRIPVLAESAQGAAGDYRQAGSVLPPAVLEAIDQRIAGAALDAKAEQDAQRGGWRR